MNPLTEKEKTAVAFFAHGLVDLLTPLKVNQEWELRAEAINRVELGFTITEAPHNYNNFDYYNGIRDERMKHWRLNFIANVYPELSWVPNEEPIRTGTISLAKENQQQYLTFSWSQPTVPLLDEFILHMHREITTIYDVMEECDRTPDHGEHDWHFEYTDDIGGDLVARFATRISGDRQMPLSVFIKQYNYWAARFYHGCRFWSLLVAQANFNITPEGAKKFLDVRPPYDVDYIYKQY